MTTRPTDVNRGELFRRAVARAQAADESLASADDLRAAGQTEEAQAAELRALALASTGQAYATLFAGWQGTVPA